eukprot:COSAG01_NODE_30331_length_618_cov_0.585742_1_plen_199_part_10
MSVTPSYRTREAECLRARPGVGVRAGDRRAGADAALRGRCAHREGGLRELRCAVCIHVCVSCHVLPIRFLATSTSASSPLRKGGCMVTTVAVVSMSRLTQCVRGVLVCHQSSGGMRRARRVPPVPPPRYLRGALLLPPVRSACGLSAVARAGLPARSAVASRHALDDAVGISPTRHTRHTHSDEPAPCIMSWARLTART